MHVSSLLGSSQVSQSGVTEINRSNWIDISSHEKWFSNKTSRANRAATKEGFSGALIIDASRMHGSLCRAREFGHIDLKRSSAVSVSPVFNSTCM